MSLTNQQGVIRFGWTGSEGHLQKGKVMNQIDQKVLIAGNTCIFQPIELADQTNIGTSNQDTNGAGWDPFDLGFYPFRGDVWKDVIGYDAGENVGTQDSSANLEHMNLYSQAPDSDTGLGSGITHQIRGPVPVIGVAHAQQGFSNLFSDPMDDAAPFSKSLPKYGMGFSNIQHKDDIGTIKIEASKLPKRAILQLRVVGGGGGAGGSWFAGGSGKPGSGGAGGNIVINYPMEMFCEGSNQPADFYLHYHIGAGGAGGVDAGYGGSGGGATFVWWNHNPEANLEDVEYTPNDVTIDASYSVVFLNKKASTVRKSSLLVIAGGGGGGGGIDTAGTSRKGGLGGGASVTGDVRQAWGGSGSSGNITGTPNTDSSGPGSHWDPDTNPSTSGYSYGTGGKNFFSVSQKNNNYSASFRAVNRYGNQSGPGGNLDLPFEWEKRNSWVNRKRSSLQSGPSPHLWAATQAVIDDFLMSNWYTAQFNIISAGGGGGYYRGSSGASVLSFSGITDDDRIGNGGAAGSSYTFHPRYGDLVGSGETYPSAPYLMGVYINGRRVEEDWGAGIPIIGFDTANSIPTYSWREYHDDVGETYGGYGFLHKGTAGGIGGAVRWGGGGVGIKKTDGPLLSGGNVKNSGGRNGLPGSVGVWIRDPGDDTWS